MGVQAFDAPENPKNKVLHNVHRREKRGMRRITYRRRGRMKAVRRLIRSIGILPDPSHRFFQKLGNRCPDPWSARVDGLHRRLDGIELATALIHMTKHRGYKSNAKREAASTKSSDDGKLIAALKEWDGIVGERTFGQVISEDHPDRKRNRPDGYNLTPRREWIIDEAHRIIARQRDEGWSALSQEWEDEYNEIAFEQLPLRSSEHLVGTCTLEPDEIRAARFAYSFEMFKLLETLLHRCRIHVTDGQTRSLTPEELQLVMSQFARTQSLTFKALRKLIGLPPDTRFANVFTDKDEAKDVAGGAYGSMYGSNIMRRVLGEDAWTSLTETPALLDQIAAVITFNEEMDVIVRKLPGMGLKADLCNRLRNGIATGKFNKFKGTGTISSKAARNLIPAMADGKRFIDACASAGYDHTETSAIDISNLGNPVVQRSLNQALKQISFLVHEFGRPKAVNIGVMRDLGKGAKARDRMAWNRDRLSSEYESNRSELSELLGDDALNRDHVLQYTLMKAQLMRCLYCDDYLSPDMITSDSPKVQVDHIYPCSRSHEDTFVNRVLACIKCIRSKGSATPYEWFGESSPDDWRAFRARVTASRLSKEHKKRLLDTAFAEREGYFINRNMNDTRYVARAMIDALRPLYPESYQNGAVKAGARRRVFARPGRMNGKLRSAWLAGRYSKNPDDGRHHSMDALVTAFQDDEMYERVARGYRWCESAGQGDQIRRKIPKPWHTFADDSLHMYYSGWVVCRTEKRRSRGSLHKETLRRRTVDDRGKVTFWQRKPVNKLTLGDVATITDDEVRESIEAWKSDDDKPDESLPVLSNGTSIRRVWIPTNIATSRRLERAGGDGGDPDSAGAFVENSKVVRCDVYRVKLPKHDPYMRAISPGYYMVPVYRLDIGAGHTPRRAIAPGKPESEWPEMAERDYLLSLYKDTFIDIVNRHGELIRGYFRTVDRGSASITISPHYLRGEKYKHRGLGVKGLEDITVSVVDRLGRLHTKKHTPIRR